MLPLMSGRTAAESAAELAIVERLLRACPTLEAEVARYESTPADFPDVDVYMKNRTKIQIELGEWIDGKELAAAKGVPRSGGSYDPKDSLSAATRILIKKITHYGPAARGVWLVIYYDRALLYNTPFQSIIIVSTTSKTLRAWSRTCSRDRTSPSIESISSQLAAISTERSRQHFARRTLHSRRDPKPSRCSLMLGNASSDASPAVMAAARSRAAAH